MADVLLRSARNAFLALLLVLIGVSSYQFLTIQRVTAEIAVVWVTGAGAFYLSKWYYGRNPEPLAPDPAEPEDEN